MREIVVGNGSMKHLLNNIPFMRIEDQGRILLIVEELANEKKIPNGIKIKKSVPNKCFCLNMFKCFSFMFFGRLIIRNEMKRKYQ